MWTWCSDDCLFLHYMKTVGWRSLNNQIRGWWWRWWWFLGGGVHSLSHLCPTCFELNVSLYMFVLLRSCFWMCLISVSVCCVSCWSQLSLLWVCVCDVCVRRVGVWTEGNWGLLSLKSVQGRVMEETFFSTFKSVEASCNMLFSLFHTGFIRTSTFYSICTELHEIIP